MSANYLSPWAKNIAPSPTLAVDAKAKALKAAGEDVCRASGQVSQTLTPPNLLKMRVLRHLPMAKPNTQLLPVCQNCVRHLQINTINMASFQRANPAQVVVSPGGKYSCYLAILATCGPGDEVLIPAPYWVSYPEMIKLAGATPKIVLAGDDQGFKVTPEQIEEALTPATKLLILNSPQSYWLSLRPCRNGGDYGPGYPQRFVGDVG